MESRVRELALFNLGIDSKLRGCDLVGLKVRDICHGDQVASRAVVMQHKTQRPVQFEITQATREAVQKWIKQAGLKSEDFVFPSRIHDSPHLGTRQYARILGGWVEDLGLDPADYGTHSGVLTLPARSGHFPDRRGTAGSGQRRSCTRTRCCRPASVRGPS
jgi:integrase